jgi:uncharacterized protein YaaQ
MKRKLFASENDYTTLEDALSDNEWAVANFEVTGGWMLFEDQKDCDKELMIGRFQDSLDGIIR